MAKVSHPGISAIPSLRERQQGEPERAAFVPVLRNKRTLPMQTSNSDRMAKAAAGDYRGRRNASSMAGAGRTGTRVKGSKSKIHKHGPDWASGLKQLYDSVIEEPIPDAFKDLLSKLDDGKR